MTNLVLKNLLSLKKIKNATHSQHDNDTRTQYRQWFARMDRTPTGNTGMAKVRVQCFVETFLLYLKRTLRMNICGLNPPQSQAANRYLQV